MHHLLPLFRRESRISITYCCSARVKSYFWPSDLIMTPESRPLCFLRGRATSEPHRHLGGLALSRIFGCHPVTMREYFFMRDARHPLKKKKNLPEPLRKRRIAHESFTRSTGGEKTLSIIICRIFTLHTLSNTHTHTHSFTSTSPQCLTCF